ncbi:hypothetical protein AYI70_g9957 [Smittium culicis]|uniref:Uncharacterized protein n=1 Tax=Smittium culicis TaxID=133412 RepID=A0A1R1X8U6_9FUNG|nr:hypothetical protein AYI70_g9957 [Smittium culicis]
MQQGKESIDLDDYDKKNFVGSIGNSPTWREKIFFSGGKNAKKALLSPKKSSPYKGITTQQTQASLEIKKIKVPRYKKIGREISDSLFNLRSKQFELDNYIIDSDDENITNINNSRTGVSDEYKIFSSNGARLTRPRLNRKKSTSISRKNSTSATSRKKRISMVYNKSISASRSSSESFSKKNSTDVNSKRSSSINRNSITIGTRNNSLHKSRKNILSYSLKNNVQKYTNIHVESIIEKDTNNNIQQTKYQNEIVNNNIDQIDHIFSENTNDQKYGYLCDQIPQGIVENSFYLYDDNINIFSPSSNTKNIHTITTPLSTTSKYKKSSNTANETKAGFSKCISSRNKLVGLDIESHRNQKQNYINNAGLSSILGARRSNSNSSISNRSSTNSKNNVILESQVLNISNQAEKEEDGKIQSDNGADFDIRPFIMSSISPIAMTHQQSKNFKDISIKPSISHDNSIQAASNNQNSIDTTQIKVIPAYLKNYSIAASYIEKNNNKHKEFKNQDLKSDSDLMTRQKRQVSKSIGNISTITSNNDKIPVFPKTQLSKSIYNGDTSKQGCVNKSNGNEGKQIQQQNYKEGMNSIEAEISNSFGTETSKKNSLDSYTNSQIYLSNLTSVKKSSKSSFEDFHDLSGSENSTYNNTPQRISTYNHQKGDFYSKVLSSSKTLVSKPRNVDLKIVNYSSSSEFIHHKNKAENDEYMYSPSLQSATHDKLSKEMLKNSYQSDDANILGDISHESSLIHSDSSNKSKFISRRTNVFNRQKPLQYKKERDYGYNNLVENDRRGSIQEQGFGQGKKFEAVDTASYLDSDFYQSKNTKSLHKSKSELFQKEKFFYLSEAEDEKNPNKSKIRPSPLNLLFDTDNQIQFLEISDKRGSSDSTVYNSGSESTTLSTNAVNLVSSREKERNQRNSIFLNKTVNLSSKLKMRRANTDLDNDSFLYNLKKNKSTSQLSNMTELNYTSPGDEYNLSGSLEQEYKKMIYELKDKVNSLLYQNVKLQSKLSKYRKKSTGGFSEGHKEVGFYTSDDRIEFKGTERNEGIEANRITGNNRNEGVFPRNEKDSVGSYKDRIWHLDHLDSSRGGYRKAVSTFGMDYSTILELAKQQEEEEQERSKVMMQQGSSRIMVDPVPARRSSARGSNAFIVDPELIKVECPELGELLSELKSIDLGNQYEVPDNIISLQDNIETYSQMIEKELDNIKKNLSLKVRF